MRDCPIAPPITAMPKPIPAANARYFLSEKSLSASAAVACANTLMLLIKMPITANSNILNLLMFPPRKLLSKYILEQTARYYFACIRYPPPLEQRRSCETDLNFYELVRCCSNE